MGRSRSSRGLVALLAAAGLAAVLSVGGTGCGWGFAGVSNCSRHPGVGRGAARKKKAVEEAPGPLEEPKRPKNAYMLWLQDNRPRLAKAKEGASVAEVSKLAGEEWRGLAAKAKSKYEKLAAEAKVAYQKELEAFEAAGGVRAPRAVRSKGGKGEKRLPKDPSKPKKPLSSYMLWLRDNRARIAEGLPAEHRMADVAKAAGQQWKKVTKKARAPYEEEYEKDKERYRQEMEEYQPA